ncbi:hypothetical protein BDN70DRAFT_490057 [Pholiota conissans]|uniref:Uncharacterized protein n=1 Tax=Pholiota conissans TaxID=109636 RepID=A0A9P5YN17_9AGAR|nr:hypothetical protein BDN70DRAFT_490057 [Pholiota conissans]
MISSNKSLGLVLCKGKLLFRNVFHQLLTGMSFSSLVLTVYSKGGGNHGKHGWVEDVSMITAASNIVVQVYQHHFGTKFYDKPLVSHAFPTLHCFDIIPSMSFLCALQNVPSAIEGGLQVSAEDLNLFKLLKSQPVKIANAMKAFRKRSRVTQVGSDGEDVED